MVCKENQILNSAKIVWLFSLWNMHPNLEKFIFRSTDGYGYIIIGCYGAVGTIASARVFFCDVLLVKRKKVPYLNTLTSLRAVGGFPTDGEVIIPQL